MGWISVTVSVKGVLYSMMGPDLSGMTVEIDWTADLQSEILLLLTITLVHNMKT